MAPSEMRALKVVSQGKAEIQTVPLPKLRDDYILVRVHFVALNPTDWKHIDRLFTPGCTVGCDLTGTVEAVGPKVTKKFTKGQKVAGFTHGVNNVEPEDGAFAEYALLKGDVAIPLPENLSWEEGSTLGVGISTVGQGLYQSLKLPLPEGGQQKQSDEFVLVYGGSTATGTLAIQYAKLSGLRVLSTNSPRNDSLVTSLGAEKTFDYNDPDCGDKIREYTGGKLAKVFDCISAGESPKIDCAAIGEQGGKISFLLPVQDLPRQDVENARTLAYTITGEAFKFGPVDMPARPEDFEFGKKFWDLSYHLLKDGKVKVHPLEVRGGGLDKIHEGLDDLRNNRVSGKKIVYNIQ